MASWPAGTGREILGSVDSTNAEALRRADSGQGGPVWILAHDQTKARARRGRAWDAGQGNFSATWLSFPEGGPALAALRSFVLSLGLYDALVEVTGQDELFALKWPNDVLLSGQKLAGILLETSTGLPDGRQALVAGVGVNLAQAPDVADLEAGALAPVCLAEATGVRIGAEAFLDILAPAVQKWEDCLVREGFAPVRQSWLDRAARRGERVVARLPGREVAGLFETVDATGAIVLTTGQSRVSLPAAEIHFT